MITCLHNFQPCAQPDYEQCPDCLTYHSTAALEPEEIYDTDYWSDKKGHSTLIEQIHNCDVHLENGITKNQFVLNAVAFRLPPGFVTWSALEIGCAPGILLKRLRQSGFDEICGVEVCQALDADIRRIGDFNGHRDAIVYGVFPETTEALRPAEWDVVISLDVFEHSPTPFLFLKECARLLKRGGHLLIMAPLVIRGVEFPKRFFYPTEHVFLHSQENLSAMLENAGFGGLIHSAWTQGHEMVSAIKV